MKPAIISLCLLLTFNAFTPHKAAAQVRWYAPRGYGYGGYGGGYGGVQTPQSAAGHAMGDVIRSQGMYNQMTSAAMVNLEEARGKYIENQKEWTDVYLTKKRALAAQHAQEHEDTLAKNARYREYLAEHPSTPSRLDSSQLIPTTGKITWPAALMRDAFAENRKELDALFAARAKSGSTSEQSTAIDQKAREMQDELRKHIREIVTQEYMEARKFLDRLSIEGRFPLS